MKVSNCKGNLSAMKMIICFFFGFRNRHDLDPLAGRGWRTDGDRGRREKSPETADDMKQGRHWQMTKGDNCLASGEYNQLTSRWRIGEGEARGNKEEAATGSVRR